MNNQNAKSRKPGLFQSISDGLNGTLREEKARLEAFLDAVPGEYCGWESDGGAIAYSEGFCRLLGLESVRTVHDIQNALSPSDAAVLEGMFERLQESGARFTIPVRSHDGARFFRLSGARGGDTEGSVHLNILWLDDVTEDRRAAAKNDEMREEAETEALRMRTALDFAMMPVWMRDAGGALTWCNRAYGEFLESTPTNILAQQKEIPLKPVKRAGVVSKPAGRALAQAAHEAGKPEHTYGHAIIAGKRRLLRITEIPLPLINMSVGAAQDITREEELEAEYQRYSAANRELLEQLGTAIAIFDAEQRLEFYNSAFAQLWGLEDTYLNARPRLGDLMEKLRENRQLPEQADFKRFKQSWLDMFTRLIGPHEDMLYLPDTSALRMLVVPHPMGGLMMTFEDVTSRLELESSYNTLIAVQKETLDNLTEGVAVFGGDGRVRLWNPSFARLWGLHPEDLSSEPHLSRVVEKLKSRFTPELWEHARAALMSQGIDRTAREGQMEMADGMLVAYSTVPLPDGGVLVTHVNVTDTAKVEKALRDKNAALETAERLKLDFLANVSYQLRTPLSTIMGFAEILDKEYFGSLNERQKGYTEGMQDAGQRLVSLIDDILDLSTLEAGYMSLEVTNVAISDVLTDLHALTSDWARKEKIEVRLECEDDIGSIPADERRLKQVLLNLIRNAITFTPEGGRITLKATREGGQVRIEVADTGRGIKKADQSRVFEPFERVQGGGQERGAGLGLTLVRNIVQLHGGHVELQSTPDVGTSVTIFLPEK